MVSIRWDLIDPENLDQLRGVDQKLIDIVLIYDKICHNSWTNIVGSSDLVETRSTEVSSTGKTTDMWKIKNRIFTLMTPGVAYF